VENVEKLLKKVFGIAKAQAESYSRLLTIFDPDHCVFASLKDDIV